MTRRFLVTGCAGFIGSHLTDTLLDSGCEVRGVDCFTDYYARELKEANVAGAVGRPGFEFLADDLRHADASELLDGVDGVYHLAAQAGVRGSFGETFEIYVRDNLVATQRLFEAAAARGIRVVFASSSSIYGDAEAYPTPEDTQPRPISPYGVTKLACEHLGRAYARTMGLDVVGLRYFTVYGPRQRPEMAFSRIVQSALTGTTFDVFGDGRQSRDVTYVGDVVSATLASMERAPSGTMLNVAGGSEVSLLHVIEEASRLSGREIDLRFVDSARGDVRRTAGDTALIQRLVGWSPETSLEEGLRAQLAWASERELVVA